MIRAYDEISDFIATGTTPELVAAFSPSQQSRDRVADPLHVLYREKSTGLTPEETSELDHYLQIEHVMRLAKAVTVHARRYRPVRHTTPGRR